MRLSSGEEVFETLQTRNTRTIPSYWTSPTQTRKHRYTCEAAALTTMDQLPLPPRRSSATVALVRNMCPSTSGATNLSLSRRKALGAMG